MIDTRGLSCPIPVVMVQQQVKKEHPAKLFVLTDNEAAIGNITRFANNNGYTVTASQTDEGDTLLTLEA